ncbi:MAG: hypothetical protein L3K09_05975 [Thermoplasmata archaeon]|nr:hypothetical protein [Thermoplasmata archaeon]
MPGGERLLDIPEIDGPTSAALPTGWLGLLVGYPGSDAALLAKQFAEAGTGTMPVYYYTTYERTEDVERTFRDFGWDPSSIQVHNLSEEYYQRVLVRDLEVRRSRERGLSLAELTEAAAAGSSSVRFSLTSRLLTDLGAINGRFRLVLDSLDFLLEVLEPAEVMTICRQVRHRAQALGGQALLAVQGEIHERRITGLLQDMADLVLEVRSEPSGSRHRHVLVVRKVRNHPERTRTVDLEVTDKGIRATTNPEGPSLPGGT